MTGEQNYWERQEREIQSYNVFFSALTARADPPLTRHGFESPVSFPEIEGQRENVKAHPDFLLYDGEVCLLVEVKQGDNIEDDHIEQIEECNKVTIERAETYLKDAEIQDKTSYDGDVSRVETCISYAGLDEDYIEKCRQEWDNCREQLEALEEKTAILGQQKGGSLRLLAGEFDDPTLQSIFERGIQLPETPKKEFTITEAWEKESLAVAICQNWGHGAASGPVEVTPTDIRSHFAPRHAIPLGRIKRVLYFLSEIGACDDVSENDQEYVYEFTVDHMGEILSVVEIVRDQPVEGHLQEEGQMDLNSFTDNDGDGDTEASGEEKDGPDDALEST